MLQELGCERLLVEEVVDQGVVGGGVPEVEGGGEEDMGGFGE